MPAAPIDTAAFLKERARALGLPPSASLAALPKLQPQHRILELPGAGGRIAAALCATNAGISFHTQFTFVAATTAEHVAIGLAAVELRANEPRVVTVDELRSGGIGSFDRVFGLRDSPLAVDLDRALRLAARLV